MGIIRSVAIRSTCSNHYTLLHGAHVLANLQLFLLGQNGKHFPVFPLKPLFQTIAKEIVIIIITDVIILLY